MRRNLFIFTLLALLLPGCIVVRVESREDVAPGPYPGHKPPTANPLPLSEESDRSLVGGLGWALLSHEVARAELEVDHAGDVQLSGEALASLEAALREHGGKASVETVREGGLPHREVYSAEDLRSLAADHRDTQSGQGEVSVYVLVLPGRFELRGVPGVAFAATAFALFPDVVGAQLPPSANVAGFQTTLAIHELGHLFGLVNLTGVGGFHEDENHPGHAKTEDSVMHWAVESFSFTELFGSGPPSEFTDADREEMRLVRNQRSS
ncbi:MAG: hypothetical protein M3O70_01165 [Actinomycetota bacterium]|nr:hypothetical protein [Actinomycetota bacterium]